MFAPRFIIIKALTSKGEVIDCFTWTRDEASGIARAEREGSDFGFDLVEVWAEEIA